MEQIYVYGDSISMQWGIPFADLAAGKYTYSRLGGGNSENLSDFAYNGESTRKMLKWIRDIMPMENTVLLFNSGLHDILRDPTDGRNYVPLTEYEDNLTRIIEIAKTKFEGIIWISTTPVDNERHAALNKGLVRRNEDVVAYNLKAGEIMRRAGIPIIDLYSYSLKEKINREIYKDHVHMKKEISERQAKYILACLETALGNNPLVSLIVPVYNVEKFLPRCIESIRGQTYRNLEIILVDDGSQDGSGEICDKAAEEDCRVRVIHKENGGLSSARNAGIDAASGDYLSFVDADDFIHSMFVEILLDVCRENSCDIAMCRYQTVEADSSLLPLGGKEDHEVDLYTNREAIYELCCGKERTEFTVAVNKLYQKKLFEEIRYPVGRIHEDEFTTYRLVAECNGLGYCREYLYGYVQRENSIMHREYSLRGIDKAEAYRERAIFLQKRHYREEYRETLRGLVYHLKNNMDSIQKYLLQEEEEVSNPVAELTEDMKRRCTFSPAVKIVLYGAGAYGRKCYEWIAGSGSGSVVGWIDNKWYAIRDTDFAVRPLDEITRLDFDFVLITVRSGDLRKEIYRHLLTWGVDREKIRCIEGDYK